MKKLCPVDAPCQCNDRVNVMLTRAVPDLNGRYLAKLEIYWHLNFEERRMSFIWRTLSKMQMVPQRAVAGGSTSKSGGSTGKAIHAILSSSLTQVLPFFCNVIVPSTPTPPTFNLQLFLDFLIFRLKFALFWFTFLFALFLSLFLSWVSKTHPNHWTRELSGWLAPD